MKKNIINSMLASALLIVLAFMVSYTEKINTDIVEISTKEIKEIQEKENIFALYVGRPTCPFCKIFSEKLESIEKSPIKIYYLNSVTSYDEASPEIKEFRDKYAIESVPDFRIFQGTKVIKELAIRDDITIKEIEKFLNSISKS